jgi:hypothetical protein
MTAVLTLAHISDDVYDDLGSGAVLGYRRLQSEVFSRINSRPSSFFGAAYCSGENGRSRVSRVQGAFRLDGRGY